MARDKKSKVDDVKDVSKPDASATQTDIESAKIDMNVRDFEVIDSETVTAAEQIEDNKESEADEVHSEESVSLSADDLVAEGLLDDESEDAPAPKPREKYKFSAEKLDAYLASAKPQDKIVQISRNGNFISRDHTIYVPITLFENK